METLPKKISFQIELDSRMPHISADYNQIHQVLLNLCLNSKDAMPNGGVLSLRTSIIPTTFLPETMPSTHIGQYVTLCVTDTGTGMSDETMGHLFEPFFTTKEVGKGTGLGLAVVYGVVKSHSGLIDVESNVGEGTTFKLYFPLLTHNGESEGDLS
jgi:two-component system, cell cycle sensor histidine kinase and response regulator CckA